MLENITTPVPQRCEGGGISWKAAQEALCNTRGKESCSLVIVMYWGNYVAILSNSCIVEGCGLAILWGDSQPDDPDVPLIQPRLIEGTATPR